MSTLSEHSSWKVLAIDDDEGVLHHYQQLLVPGFEGQQALHQLQSKYIQNSSTGSADGDADFSLTVASSGEQGLQQVVNALEQGDPFAVICIDMRMPAGWNGITTAERIRAVDQDVKLIFVTAYSDYSLSDLRKRLGNQFDFLSKPVKENEFLQLIFSSAESWTQLRLLRETKAEVEQLHDQISASLALEKEHTELIIESMREGVVVVDRFGNIEEVNPKVEQMLELPEEAVAGKPVATLFEQQWGEDCEIHSLVLGASRLQKMVDQDQSILERRIDGSILALMLVDQHGAVLQSNSAMEELSGWRSEQLIRGGVEMLVPQQMRRVHQLMMAQFHQQPEPRRMGKGHVFPMLLEGGTTKEVEISLLPIHYRGEPLVLVLLYDPKQQQQLQLFRYSALGALFLGEGDDSHCLWQLKSSTDASIPVELSGSPIFREYNGRRQFGGVVLVIRDLRGKIEAENAVRENRAKDQFVAAMSHELRSPLTTIIGNSELLADEIWGDLSPTQQDMLRAIEISGRTQLSLVNDILDLSKISAGKFEILQVEFDPLALLSEIEKIFSVRAKTAGLTFTVKQQQPFQWQLVGDQNRIAQILVNLLSNAIKFSSEGEIVLRIWFDQEWLHFEVIDQGIGIPEVAIPRLFQPYEQADHAITEQFGGTGLGLHISSTLAQLMGGTIVVESEEGVGSCFRLDLPYRPGQQRVQRAEPDRKKSRLRLQGSVLLVEDTPELQLLLQRMLQSMGITVVVADNGKQGVDIASMRPFDLILMDMQMPVMDGVTATAALRTLGYRSPIVALSANAMSHQQQQFFEAGVDDFLAKPIERKQLLQVLTRYLQ